MTKIGLDLGSSSIGWAIRNDEKISNKGVITFSTGMLRGQQGYSSPTRDRRDARAKRNLIRARKYRKWELLRILCQDKMFVPLELKELEGWSKYKKGDVKKFPENPEFLKWLACDFAYEGGIRYNNPYELRVRALDNKLTNHEFGRVLYHIVQRRGYKDIGETDKETQTQIERRNDGGFQDALNAHRTIGEALLKGFIAKGKRARNEYPYREEYQNEIEAICEAQGYDITKTGNNEYHDPFVSSLWKAIIWQRPLRTQKGKIGKCTLEPSKQRIPISHPIFEISRAWQFINTIKYYNKEGEGIFLTNELRNDLYHDIFLKRSEGFKFEVIRKFLDKKLNSKAEYNYPLSEKTRKYETSIPGMPFCNGFIRIFGDHTSQFINEVENFNMSNAPKIISGYSVLDIWHGVFDFDEEYLETFAKNKLKIENVQVRRNKKEVSLSPLVILKRKMAVGYGDLSVKALNQITPFLKEGYLYNEAVVFARLPELLDKDWNQKRSFILDLARKSNEIYDRKKQIIGITNNLIDKYKGAVETWRNGGEPVIAWKNSSYVLDEFDESEIVAACIGYFGEGSWNKRSDQDLILSEVGKEYQDFYFDFKRSYREVPTLTELFQKSLLENGIVLKGELYHHSKRPNIYGGTVIDYKTQKEILPIPMIDSIKNPMFNKSMSILRRLMNELILKGEIDEDTEVVVEVARELNDNNKRAAIERFQNERRAKREKIKTFLEEFKEKEKISFNVDERIRDFEIWSEQVFGNTDDTTGQKAKEVLREKDTVKRYALWMEQKGQCMYTGKMISITQLFSNEIDVEHTIPRSLLPDNTLANLTVCYAKYNRIAKGKLMPYYCENYSRDVEDLGTAIIPRLTHWEKTRDSYRGLYESRFKPSGNEDEGSKNKRIQDKHYFKMHYEYWKDKISRFTASEVKDSWARRQLVDTQMVSKYAREFLKTYFRKVAVQKGEVTSDFRKMYGFQKSDEAKNRNKHTHHAIDAAVLTLIPVNSSRRDALLKKMYKIEEDQNKQYTTKPYPSFNSQELISGIENEVLIFNYEKDKILQQTTRNIRKRGKLQYITDSEGNYMLDETGNRIIMKSKGDTVRSTLYAQTYLGRIRDVERDYEGRPIWDGEDWKYKTGENEFVFVERKPLKDVLSKLDDIIDPAIKKIVKAQRGKSVDAQGNKIRHVRVKVRAGKEVKERQNYRSKHSYKNKFYSSAGSIPYSIMLQNSTLDGFEREMIPVASYEIAKVYKQLKKFTPEDYLEIFHPHLLKYADIKLLKVGQNVLVLKNDIDFEQRMDFGFQRNRLYKITQFGKGTIYLKHHLIATRDDDIDKEVKSRKDEIVAFYDKKFGLSEVEEDMTILDVNERKKKYEDERYRFVGIKDHRFQRLLKYMDEEDVNQIRKELSKYKKQSSKIEIEGETPLLKLNKAEGWNFLYENYDFKLSTLGRIEWF